MKRSISILLSIVMILCIFTFVMPSFALSYGDFTYEIVDEKIIITGYTGTDEDVTVPSEIDGVSVAKIGDGAFKGNTVLKSVTVTSGAEDIGASAFENCTNLATISLPTTIIHIGEKAIYNTAYYNDESNWKVKPNNSSSSGGIDFGNGTPQISWEDISAENLDYLYLGKNLIEITYSGSYTLKYGTRVIADGAFSGCGAVQLTTSEQLVAIGNNAFKDCASLKEIKFFDSLEIIGDSAFEGCTSFEKIELPDKDIQMNASAFYNTGYYNNPDNWEGNALYYRDMVIGVRENVKFADVKEGTTKIISGALLDKTVLIPESVVEISDTAFTDKSSAIILGYSDTYAHQYATLHNIKFVDLSTLIKGDLNFDGLVEKSDYEILCNVCATREYQSKAISYAGDMNEDGAVDGIDAVILDLFLNNMGPSTIKGDANGDGEVDESDYEFLIKISLGNEIITDNFMFDRCDLNGDGAVDNFDVIYLDLFLKGFVTLV